MFLIVEKVMSIFVIVLIGFILYRLGAVGDDSIKPITSILMNVSCPCLIITSLYSKELTGNILGDSLAVMAGVMLFYIFASLLTFLFVMLTKIGRKEDIGVLMAAVAATNSGFMGFPIVKALYGSDMLYLMVMGNMMLNVYMVWMEPSILTIGTKSRPSAKDMLNALKTPFVISLFVGFAMAFLHIKPSGIVDETMVMLGDVTIPLSMILVGIRLGSVKLREIISRNNIIISIFAMIVVPLLVMLIMLPMGFINNDVKTIIAVTAILPTAVIAVVIAEQYGKNSLLLSEIVSLTTIMSVVTIPFMAVVIDVLFR